MKKKMNKEQPWKKAQVQLTLMKNKTAKEKNNKIL